MDNEILAFFTQYAQDYANAQQLITDLTTGVNVPTFLQQDIPDVASRQMQLIYEPSGTSGGAGPNLLNLPQPTQPADQPQLPSTQMTLTFDISLSVPGLNGIPQQINYGERSRQSIGQTAVGFHVNEFGMAIGSLDIDAIITFRGVAYAQVQAFFGFLQTIKQPTNPLTVSNPGQLIFIDAYLSRRLAISLVSVNLAEVAGLNDQGHLTLSASILADYGTMVSTQGVPVNTPPTSLSNSSALLNDILQFVGTTFP